MDVPTGVMELVSASEEASLHGHKAKTPIIAGAISGGCVGAAWIIGFIIYFYKRHRRERRARALGFKGHREMLDPPKKKEAFIIPPDPAIVEAGYRPGEKIYDDPKVQDSDLPKHARTIPMAQVEEERTAGLSPRQNGGLETVPEIPHSTSAPSRVPQADETSPSSSPTSPTRPPHVLGSFHRISSEMTIPSEP